MQIGTHAREDSISVAVDVATNLMVKTGVIVKFTVEELRDNISKYQCGCKGQSCKFNSLDKHLKWKKKKTKSLKLPIVQLSQCVFF